MGRGGEYTEFDEQMDEVLSAFDDIYTWIYDDIVIFGKVLKSKIKDKSEVLDRMTEESFRLVEKVYAQDIQDVYNSYEDVAEYADFSFDADIIAEKALREVYP